MGKNILKGKEWLDYLNNHNWKTIPYIRLYSFTYKYVQVFKVGDYYFTVGINRGYKIKSSLKRCII